MKHFDLSPDRGGAIIRIESDLKYSGTPLEHKTPHSSAPMWDMMYLLWV